MTVFSEILSKIEALKEEIEVNRIYHAEDVAEFIDRVEKLLSSYVCIERKKLEWDRDNAWKKQKILKPPKEFDEHSYLIGYRHHAEELLQPSLDRSIAGKTGDSTGEYEKLKQTTTSKGEKK